MFCSRRVDVSVYCVYVPRFVMNRGIFIYKLIIKSKNEPRLCFLKQLSEAKKLGSTRKGGFFAESVVVRFAAGAKRHPVLKEIQAGRELPYFLFTNVILKRFRHHYCPLLRLIVFQNSDNRPANGESRAVQ